MNKENKLIFLISNFEQPIGGAQVHILTLIKIVYKLAIKKSMKKDYNRPIILIFR